MAVAAQEEQHGTWNGLCNPRAIAQLQHFATETSSLRMAESELPLPILQGISSVHTLGDALVDAPAPGGEPVADEDGAPTLLSAAASKDEPPAAKSSALNRLTDLGLRDWAPSALDLGSLLLARDSDDGASKDRPPRGDRRDRDRSRARAELERARERARGAAFGYEPPPQAARANATAAASSGGFTSLSRPRPPAKPAPSAAQRARGSPRANLQLTVVRDAPARGAPRGRARRAPGSKHTAVAGDDAHQMSDFSRSVMRWLKHSQDDERLRGVRHRAGVGAEVTGVCVCAVEAEGTDKPRVRLRRQWSVRVRSAPRARRWARCGSVHMPGTVVHFLRFTAVW